MINEWNPVLTSDDEPIYSNIFHKSPYDMEYKLLFLTTIQCNWTDMKEIIESTFKSSNLGSFGKSLGILTKLGELPNLIPIDEFFKDKYGFRFAKKINCIVLSSFQECN